MDLKRWRQSLRLRSGRTKKKSSFTDDEAQLKRNTEVRQPAKPSTNKPRPSAKQMESVQEIDAGENLPESDHGSYKRRAGRQSQKKGSLVMIGGKLHTMQQLTGQGGGHQYQTVTEVEPASENQPPVGDLEEDMPPAPRENYDEAPHVVHHYGSSDDLGFDLKPPKSLQPKALSIEWIASSMFSAGHLNTILSHSRYLSRFSSFLHRYRPDAHPLLVRYIERSKAVAAAEYASAVAEGLDPSADGSKQKQDMFSIEGSFRNLHAADLHTLVEDVLPTYITYNLIKIISECLGNEITGHTTPLMRNVVGGLSEVFCLTDPHQHDNPIIYASEDFYILTGYNRNDAIGYNCRFLQGAKTRRSSVAKIRTNLEKSQETYETILNYRRDGRPFINVLMVAPLFDDKGEIKYYIGAQVDVSGLVTSRQALEEFQRYLVVQRQEQQEAQAESSHISEDAAARQKAKALTKLQDMSRFFDVEENTAVQSHSRGSSLDRDNSMGNARSESVKTPRKILVDSDVSDEADDDEGVVTKGSWTLGQAGPAGPSGRLPGIYEKYMLVRPSPSLRIIFVSRRLQSYGKMIQSPFLSHVAASQSTLRGMKESFGAGQSMSARIRLMAQRGESRDGTKVESSVGRAGNKYGRACWISATPLMGADDQVGVWMIVFVGNNIARKEAAAKAEKVTEAKSLVSQNSARDQDSFPMRQWFSRLHKNEDEDGPNKPKRVSTGSGNLAVEAHRGTVHRGIVTAPVEEYRSSSEDSREVTRRLPKVGQTPTSQREDGLDTDEEFMIKRTPLVQSPSSYRITINPDSDGEQDDKKYDMLKSRISLSSVVSIESMAKSANVPRTAIEHEGTEVTQTHRLGVVSAAANGKHQVSSNREDGQHPPLTEQSLQDLQALPSLRSDERDDGADTAVLHNKIESAIQVDNNPQSNQPLTPSRLSYLDHLYQAPRSGHNPGSRTSPAHPFPCKDEMCRTKIFDEATGDTKEDTELDVDCEKSPASVD